ncbi:MAG: histidine kinase [Rubrivivax sp.]|nr:histidine kinase [Rubrivivax sp.]
MATLPDHAGPGDPGPDAAFDGAFDASGFEQSLNRHPPRRWAGWRLRLLVLAMLLGCGAVVLVARALAGSAHLPSSWQPTAGGLPTLLASPHDPLRAMGGRTLARITAAGQPPLAADELLLRHTARWLVDREARARYVALQEQLAALLAQGEVELHFTDGSRLVLATPPRGWGGVPLPFWAISAFALLLHGVGATVLLKRPNAGHVAFAVMTSCHAASLLLIAAEPWRGLGQPAGLAALDLGLRQALEVVTAAAGAGACAYALQPRPLPHARWLLGLTLGTALLWSVAAARSGLAAPWALTQAALLALGVMATAAIGWSNRLRPDPIAATMQRFALSALATLAVVTLAVAAAQGLPSAAATVASTGAEVWYLYFGSLLMLMPSLSRPRRVLREFALLAGIGTITTSLGLVFVALFSLGPLGSLVLATVLALGVYVGARRWILARMVGAGVLSTERTFERLYRVAREAHEHPGRTAPLLSQLLHDLFQPQEMLTLARRLGAARVVGAGSALYVPLPGPGDRLDLDHVLVLRHAGQGQRLFTHEDARLAERVVEQVCRVLAHDRAVEQGRTEERARIAQDLHDDIGARLLTLMYKAGDPEIEDYIRHTLQDLKTLTRGLAASSHPLSHAAGEWKADLAQRLGAAGLRLDWRFDADRELVLSVVQWSALTRILRELVSNAIAHADAERVAVELQLDGDALTLVVADDGRGSDPQAWSHGLGLGGVRKRVRGLGGSVHWAAQPGGTGIVCTVRLPAAPPNPGINA